LASPSGPKQVIPGKVTPAKDTHRSFHLKSAPSFHQTVPLVENHGWNRASLDAQNRESHQMAVSRLTATKQKKPAGALNNSDGNAVSPSQNQNVRGTCGSEGDRGEVPKSAPPTPTQKKGTGRESGPNIVEDNRGGEENEERKERYTPGIPQEVEGSEVREEEEGRVLLWNRVRS